MAKIKKKVTDQYFTDIGRLLIKAFRESGTTLEELIENPEYDKDSHGRERWAYFCIGRYLEDRNNVFVSDSTLKLIKSASFDNFPDAKIRLPFKTFKIRFPVDSGLCSCIITVSRSSILKIAGKGEFIEESRKNGYEAMVSILSGVQHKGDEILTMNATPINEILTHDMDFGDSQYPATFKKSIDYALKFCVLHSTGALNLEDGHPLPTKYDKPKVSGKNFNFGFNKADFNEEMFVRPHFRNLRDPRYYKKEPYDTWEIGSRWTFVNGKTINANSTTA
ncbi:TPA: hypothetical protein ACGUM0_004135 [Vibrio vulnificus]